VFILVTVFIKGTACLRYIFVHEPHGTLTSLFPAVHMYVWIANTEWSWNVEEYCRQTDGNLFMLFSFCSKQVLVLLLTFFLICNLVTTALITNL
jgi:hypothetical protein